MNGRDASRVLAQPTGRPKNLREHEALFGPIQRVSLTIDELVASGVTGRGGAAFPTAKKVQLLLQQRRSTRYVVVNAMEGEPAAHKDRTLLENNPHLVLDGAYALANLLDADTVMVCVARENRSGIAAVKAAIAERGPRKLQGPSFEVQTPPGRYVAGEESALVHWLDDHETLPQYRPTKPSILKIGRGAVLVDNAETHANVGLIARFGAEWFRQVGTPQQPGTAVTSVTGHGRAVVVEAAYGTPIAQILQSGQVPYTPKALILGGYGGSVIDGRYLNTPFDNESLRALDATTGAGVIVALPPNSCGVAETAQIVDYMARESARQCGPCAFGLPAMAEDLARLRTGRQAQHAMITLTQRCASIAGRGACRHPDGVIRFVRSALHVFADDFAQHASGNPCAHALTSRFAFTPRSVDVRELVWE